MLLRVALKSGYIATQIAENVMEQQNMLLQVFLCTCHLPQNLQRRASLQYGSAQCASRGFGLYCTSCHKTCRLWLHFCMDYWCMLLQIELQTENFATKLRLGFKLTMSSTFSLVSLFPKYPHSLTQFPPQFQPFPTFCC